MPAIEPDDERTLDEDERDDGMPEHLGPTSDAAEADVLDQALVVPLDDDEG